MKTFEGYYNWMWKVRHSFLLIVSNQGKSYHHAVHFFGSAFISITRGHNLKQCRCLIQGIYNGIRFLHEIPRNCYYKISFFTLLICNKTNLQLLQSVVPQLMIFLVRFSVVARIGVFIIVMVIPFDAFETSAGLLKCS